METKLRLTNLKIASFSFPLNIYLKDADNLKRIEHILDLLYLIDQKVMQN